MFDFKRLFLAFSTLLCIVLFLPSCAKKESRINRDKLKFEEYKEKIAKSFDQKDKRSAMIYLEKLIGYYPERADVEHYRLALADLYYELGNRHSDKEYLAMAAKLYQRFYKRNPSSDKTEYASYQRILSNFKQTNKIDCDCSSYEKTINLCKNHLEKPFFKGGKFEKDVRDIKYTCECHLIDKEEYVFKNSLRADQLETAKSRLKYLEDTYLPTHPDLVPRIAYLHCKLALKLKDKTAAEEKARFLEDQFKDSEFPKMARNLIARKELENRLFL